MSQTSDLMELKEELITAKYPAANSLLDGFDHTPRLAKAKSPQRTTEKSSGTATRRRFRSTCLLYTSPSPRDLSTSRMPSSA